MSTHEERQVALLEELLAYTRFMARDALEQTLRSIVKDERHRIALELTDGTRSQSQVGSEAGLAQSAISDLWKKWRRLGLVRERDGRHQHLVRPSDLGFGAAVTPKRSDAQPPSSTNAKE